MFLPGTMLFSQQLSHQVLVPLAGVKCDNKLSFSQTVGETAVEQFGCYDFIFTQGFQQPGIKLSLKDAPSGTGVSVYPNPVDDCVTIEMFGETAKTLRIEIMNITGTVLISDKLSFTEQYWYKDQRNVSGLIKGFYFVRILSEDGLINRTFKIEKI